MDQRSMEEFAIETYGQAQRDPSRPARAAGIVRALLGRDAIVRTTIHGTRACTFWHYGQERIGLSDSVTPEQEDFDLFHELGHIRLRRGGYRGTDEERLANAFAGAMVCPAPAMERLRREVGLDIAAMARMCGCTQTWAALRRAEVFAMPTIVVTTRHHWAIGLAPDPAIVEDLRKHPRRARPGLARSPIRDAKGRVAWVKSDAVAA